MRDVKLSLGDDCPPLVHLLAIMREPRYPIVVRMKAAKIAAPYCHKRQRHIRFDEQSNLQVISCPVLVVANVPAPIE